MKIHKKYLLDNIYSELNSGYDALFDFAYASQYAVSAVHININIYCLNKITSFFIFFLNTCICTGNSLA